MTPAQFALPLRDIDWGLLKSAKVREACRVVAKDLGFKRVADLWGLDSAGGEAQVSQKLDERERKAMKPHELLILMAVDNRGVILAALCDALGYEMPERKLLPGSEDQRLVAVLRDMLPAEFFELAQRKAGL